MVDMASILDELKTVKEEECLNSSYNGITKLDMKEVPSSVIYGDDHNVFHCDTSFSLTVNLKKSYLSLKCLAKLSEICYKHSNDVKIDLERREIIMRWKR